MHTNRPFQSDNRAHTDAPEMSDETFWLYEMVREQRDPDFVRRVLLGDCKLAARIDDLPSYKQPNGFWTIKLGGFHGDTVLRLHFWPEGLKEKTETAGIHDHVFNFTSLVMPGSAPMVNTHYGAQIRLESELALYEVDYLDPTEQKITKLSDYFHPVAIKKEIIQPGEYYTFPAGSFHRSEIQNGQQGLTLMATKNDRQMLCPRFVAAASLEVKPTYSRVPLTVDEKQRVLKAVMDAPSLD